MPDPLGDPTTCLWCGDRIPPTIVRISFILEQGGTRRALYFGSFGCVFLFFQEQGILKHAALADGVESSAPAGSRLEPCLELLTPAEDAMATKILAQLRR